MSRCAIKPFSAVGTGMTAIALLCLCALTILSREALAGYRPRPPLAGGAGRGFGPGGRGPVPYGAGGPGRFGPGGQGPSGMRGPGGLMGARGPGPVIPPSLSGPGSQMGVPPAGGAHAGIPGGMPAGGRFDFSSASHWSNFGPGHQYPSVPMGNLQGGLPGAQLPTGEDIAGGALPADDPLTADPSNDLFNYMLQNEDSLSNQAPSTSWFARSLDSNESSETASAEGMGVEDGNRDETEGEREKAENDESPPKESNENSVFLAKREDSRKEQGNEEAKKEALKAKETLAHEQLKKKHHKADEAKEEEAKKEEANKSKTDEALDKEETDNGNDDENEEGTSSSGTHKLESHKKESHAEESHKEESHQEEHTSA